jgi:F-type H+-transporting ATPase subunit b
MRYALVIFFSLLFLTHFVQAADVHSSPFNSFFYGQVENFLIFAGILFFLIRKPIKNYYQSQRTQFLALQLEANKTKEIAQKKFDEISERLRLLNDTRDASIDQARVDALAIAKRYELETKDIEKRYEREAAELIQLQEEKARVQLQDYLLNQAMNSARVSIQEQLNESSHRSLQSESIRKIEVVAQ